MNDNQKNVRVPPSFSEEGLIVFNERNTVKESGVMAHTIVFEFSPLSLDHIIHVMVCNLVGVRNGDDRNLSYSKSFIECNRSQAQRMGVYQMDHFTPYQIERIFGEENYFSLFPPNVEKQK